jgi:hypothetical protein
MQSICLTVTRFAPRRLNLKLFDRGLVTSFSVTASTVPRCSARERIMMIDKFAETNINLAALIRLARIGWRDERTLLRCIGSGNDLSLKQF